jgi:hypothetical protein
MKTRINHTGRKRIARRDVGIKVDSRDESQFKCSVHPSLSSYGFKGESPVILECYAGPEYARFSFGTVGIAPESAVLDLSQFVTTYKVLFRLKVLDANAPGKLLGLADQVPITRPEIGDDTGQSLITVRPGDIGQRLWKLSFEDEDGRPVLVINDQIKDWKEFTGASSVIFQSAVLPTVFEQTLERILIIENSRFDPDSTDWRDQFIKMAEVVGKRPYTVQDRRDDNTIRSWIDSITSEFSERHSFASRVLRSFK